jgi:hypothetical protein
MILRAAEPWTVAGSAKHEVEAWAAAPPDAPIIMVAEKLADAITASLT